MAFNVSGSLMIKDRAKLFCARSSVISHTLSCPTNNPTTVPNLRIVSAFFLGEKNVVVSGRRSFFYLYDSIAGKLSEHWMMGRAEKSCGITWQ